MKRSNAAAAAAAQETAFIDKNDFNLIDFPDQDDLDIADILLLLSNSKPAKNPDDDFSLARESQSLHPVWVGRKKRSATKRPGKEKICIKKELPPSPETPLLFSSTEIDGKLKRKIRVDQNTKRQILKKNVEGLIGCRDSLKEELQKMKAYYSQLQGINSALKAKKQDMNTTTTTSSKGNANQSVVTQQQQQQQQPYNNVIVNQKATDASCSSTSSLMNSSWQTQIQNFHQQCSSRTQLGMGGFLFFPSGHHLVVNNRPDFKVHPSDLRLTILDAEKRAKCAEARRLRMANNKMKQTRRLTSSTAKIKIRAPTLMSR